MQFLALKEMGSGSDQTMKPRQFLEEKRKDSNNLQQDFM